MNNKLLDQLIFLLITSMNSKGRDNFTIGWCRRAIGTVKNTNK